MRIHITLDRTVPKGKIAGSGAADNSEHWISIHPRTNIRAACAAVAMTAQAHANGSQGTTSRAVDDAEIERLLERAEVLVDGVPWRRGQRRLGSA